LIWIISVYLGFLTFEVYIGIRQKVWEKKKMKVFGITESRADTEKRFGLRTEIGGGLYRYFPKEIPFDFPIGMEPNTTYLGFNEGLGYPIVRTDSHGFFNKEEWWNDSDIILLGDSFVSCTHIEFTNSFVNQMRQKGYKALSLGTTGTGPYFQLAALRHYIPAIGHPIKHVVWVYYEGNDLNDAIDESEVPFLKDVVNDYWAHGVNYNRIQELKSRHTYGVDNQAFKTLSLYRTRYAFKELLEFPEGALLYKKVGAVACKSRPDIIFVRVKRLGVSYDKAWKEVKRPFKNIIEFPAEPQYYGSGITTSHLNAAGYKKLIELLEPYLN
jgi:hypothetical protein